MSKRVHIVRGFDRFIPRDQQSSTSSPREKVPKKPEDGASKRAGEMDDAQGLGVDLDDIEAGGDIKAVVGLQIPLGGPGQKVLF